MKKKNSAMKKAVGFVLAVVMALGLVVPVMAYEETWAEDGVYFLRGWAGQQFNNISFMQISLVSQEPIREVWDMQQGSTIHLPLGSQLVIELFQVPDTPTMHLEHAVVELGLFNGNAIRHEEIEDGWMWYAYELEYDYTTLLNYNRASGGMVTGGSRVVYTFDTPGDFTVRHSFSQWVRGSNAAEGLAAPPRISVGGGGSFPIPLNGVAIVEDHPNTPPNISTANSWAHADIAYAFNLGLIPQQLQNNYNQNATRADFAAFAVALYETVTGREIIGRMEFNDTNDVNVQMMGYLGVVTGVGEGNFAPDNGLTREQAAVMISRLANAIGRPLESSPPMFNDNEQISDWAVDAVGQVQAIGIMGGVGHNQFDPAGSFTREQSIITMVRLFVRLNYN
ncbi:MAG: S-layer homology domain-containing protein [Defluviitaleaceae bacterium]|nr:S-layer homology domain-containing protein [Defluviitaleaceae bacterium]